MGAEDRQNVVGVVIFLSNIVSSISIIMINKQLMGSAGYGFNFATTLCGLHFLCTFITSRITAWAFGLEANNANGEKKPTTIPLFDAILYAVFADMSIVGMNLSLMMNTVGFYQIAKLSIIPLICCIDYIWLYKRFNSKIIMAIGVVLLGVGISTVSDVGFNVPGVIVAGIAVFSTAMQQVLVGHLQKKHQIGANELVSTTAPIQAISLLILGPMLDRLIVGRYIWEYEMNVPTMVYLLWSCFLAAVVNISQFFCIGRFSAISFQVLGNTKTVGVLFFGWMLFDHIVTWRNMTGMSMAVLGMFLYGLFVTSDPPRVATPAASGPAASPRPPIALVKTADLDPIAETK
mmetsp:Transcript_12657/g.21438  ORF Transcript_12657/g.21438 Transcript_12657/m.21438 type:complete len:347 (+) Transcript_12657:165-1205(+)|eukprot:CAMPEP_0198211688 /NCGR_PEP_ID=MMETSP1445-20131203/25129_1 /TAXON_ID=36898 /ORGANISM="Pyramimonas sp., Strain CCMP2087" /LENGTH=346 /DNA_ID=CAMNT_0043886009 /DNA_START=165 /DNA_END=1205 /DNA_ORIENTATION=+